MRWTLHEKWNKMVKRMLREHFDCSRGWGYTGKRGHVQHILWYIDRIDRLGAIINIEV